MNMIVQILNKMTLICVKQNLSLFLSVFIHGVCISIIGISSIDIPDYQTEVLDVDFLSVQTPKRIVSNSKKIIVNHKTEVPRTIDLYRPNHNIQSSPVVNKTIEINESELDKTSMYDFDPCSITNNQFSSIDLQVEQTDIRNSNISYPVKPTLNRPEKEQVFDISELNDMVISPLPLTLPDISEPTQNARFLQKVDPLYPESARHTHQEGLVVLEATIDIDGKAKDISVVEVINVKGLGCEDSAIQALKASQFTPAMNGKTVISQRLRIPYRFSLKS
ncbi:energy transducer TonB [Candidatus Poribacteria bacterium]|nr:energy transducer TonB [Candidatus Poribacteria bacterium]